ncbi:MAG: hypothetical protein HDT27_03455 [Subdoligranulum sp.]|nr:hypothetical protein [Subdoligranulum sp.]
MSADVFLSASKCACRGTVCFSMPFQSEVGNIQDKKQKNRQAGKTGGVVYDRMQILSPKAAGKWRARTMQRGRAICRMARKSEKTQKNVRGTKKIAYIDKIPYNKFTFTCFFVASLLPSLHSVIKSFSQSFFCGRSREI